jgi:hypothetical protein
VSHYGNTPLTSKEVAIKLVKNITFIGFLLFHWALTMNATEKHTTVAFRNN